MFKSLNGKKVKMSSQEIEELDEFQANLTTTDSVSEFETKLNAFRYQRDVLLSESDWTQTVDSPLSVSKKKSWAKYRQELRDLTNNIDDGTDFDALEFPVKP